jgi:hypothetical protein
MDAETAGGDKVIQDCRISKTNEDQEKYKKTSPELM